MTSLLLCCVHTQVMHDEAVTNAVPVMNQMTIGLDFLNKTLGVRPQVGWHIGETLRLQHTRGMYGLLT